MLEISSVKKNKINLSDYNSEQDIFNRILMSNFSTFDVEVLEEILFSPLKISLKKLARSLGCSEAQILPILTELASGGLLSIKEDNILIDKEMRKYFEFHITRFDPAFKPDMEFLQGLLRKVPIHCLPAWHAIPRTSNNIFESIAEKYLISPHIFQRYLNELSFANPVVSSIVSDLFGSSDFKLASTDVISKYNLPRRQFEEILLLLEFSFVCCLTYEKEGDHWIEFITPFHEWHQYLLFLKQTETSSLPQEALPLRIYKTDFAFIEDMSSILTMIKNREVSLLSWEDGKELPIELIHKLAPFCSISNNHSKELYEATLQQYLNCLLKKLCMIRLVKKTKGKIEFLEQGDEWLNMTLEERSLYLYRHPLNKLLNEHIPPHLVTEKNIREAEKSIKRVLTKDWVLFDDFLKGVLVPFGENSQIILKKTGKQWRYTLPSYNEDEKALLKAVLFEWLFETGMIIPGSYEGKDCFKVTDFGKFFFKD